MAKNITYYIDGNILNCSNIPNIQDSNFDFLELSNYLFSHHEIKHLIFSNCNINLGRMRCTQDNKYLCFANSLRMEHIESVDVSNNNFSAINFLLRGIGQISAMQSINLSNCNIDDHYLKDLIRIFNNYYPNLVELNLSNNHITNYIIDPLVKVIKNGGFTNCHILDLSGNNIAYDNIKKLIEAINSSSSCHIEILRFNNGFITTEETAILNELLINKNSIDEHNPKILIKKELSEDYFSLITQLTTMTKVKQEQYDQIKTILYNSTVNDIQKNKLLDILHHEQSAAKLADSYDTAHIYYLSKLVTFIEDIKSTVNITGDDNNA